MFPVGLDDALWKKAGVDLAKLTPAQGEANVKEGVIPMLRFAGFDLPQIPAVEGTPISDIKASMDTDLGGVLGAGLLSLFRVTFGDGGRFLWLEADPALLAPPPPDRGGPGAAPPAPAPDAKPAGTKGPSGATKPETKSDSKRPGARP